MRIILLLICILPIVFVAAADSDVDPIPELSEFVSSLLSRQIVVTDENFASIRAEIETKFKDNDNVEALMEFLDNNAEEISQAERSLQKRDGGYFDCSSCICGKRVATLAQAAARARVRAEQSRVRAEKAQATANAKATAATAKASSAAQANGIIEKRQFLEIAETATTLVKTFAPQIKHGITVLGIKFGRCRKKCSFKQARTLASVQTKAYCLNGEPFD